MSLLPGGCVLPGQGDLPAPDGVPLLAGQEQGEGLPAQGEQAERGDSDSAQEQGGLEEH